MRGGDTERLDLAGLDLRQRRHGHQHGEIDLVADEIGDDRRAALVRHVQDIDARLRLDAFHREVQHGADTRGGVAELARLRARELQELGEVFGRQAGARDDDHRRGVQHADRREVAQAVVAHRRRRDEARNGDRAVDADQQRVTVRRRLDRPLHADDAARAGDVLDDHVLLEPVLQPRGEHASGEVDIAAGGERHDQRDGFRAGPGLRARQQWHAQCEREQ